VYYTLNESGMKILSDQTFWLGAMTAFAVGFFGLFVGMVTNKVSIGDAPARVAVGGGEPGGYPAEPGAAPAPAAPQEIVVEEVTKDDWVRGDRGADVSVVEFSDIDCPFCSRFHTTMKTVLEKYDGQINWVYRDFPLDALHPQARDKSIAAECVGKLAGNDAYWTYLDGLFASSAADEVTAEATKLGIDAAAFEECRQDPSIAEGVSDEVAQAARAGGSGTPYSVIVAGDQTIPVNGALPEQQLTALIEQALAN